MKYFLTDSKTHRRVKYRREIMALIMRENLNTRVYKILKEMISNSRFEPGARINVESLTKEIGTSRTPIWEAIRRLEQEGLVVHYPSKGTFMNSLSPEQALQLYEVRTVLEGLAARHAAQAITHSELTKMAECLEKQKSIVDARDMFAYSQNDFEFHSFIYNNCGNEYLNEQLENIKNKMRPLGIHFEDALFQFYNDHQALYSALKAHDSKRAEEVIILHNHHMMDIIREKITSSAVVND